jgi:hypothetical protein
MRNRRPAGNRPNPNRNFRKPERPQRAPRLHTIPANLLDGVVIFDNDEFYGVYLDLLLVDFKRADLVKVETRQDFEQFKIKFTQGDYQKNLYLVDELFGWGEVDLTRLVQNLRLKDPAAYVVGLTAVADGEIENRQLYDAVAVKSKGNHDQSMSKVLSAHWGVELNYAGAEPEKGYL